MQFQIIKVIIWPRNQTFAPQVIPFEKGKVNVITGGSRTGKSAIIPIIDYCLASTDCHIPIDTIRDHSSWFGVIFETENEQVLLARRGPEGRASSDEFHLARGTNLSIPPVITKPNEKRESVKHILNAMSGTPYFKLNGLEEARGYQDRLSFRDLMALVFQSQDVVANQNVLFYKTHAHEHRERLKNWLPYILGAENAKILAARQRLGAVQTRLNQLRREAEKAKKISESWLANMIGSLQVAKQYGLLKEDFIASDNQVQLIEAAKLVLSNAPDRPEPTVKHIERGSEDAVELEEIDTKLSDEISHLRKRLDDIHRLKATFVGYGGSTRKRADRLQISEWLESVSKTHHECPLCGSHEHDKAVTELEKIAVAFRKVEEAAKKTSEIPASFTREEESLKNEIELALSRKVSMNARLDKRLAHDNVARETFLRSQNMFFFLGHLKASLETFESIATGGVFDEEIASLVDEERSLIEITDPAGVERRLGLALAKISQLLLVHLETLDVEEKYRVTPPHFSVKDLSLKVRSNDGYWHFLAEVGSASNWLSFHIGFICALHEYLNGLDQSCVPSFAVFDQPSQVYFPKTNRAMVNTEDPIDAPTIQYDDEDVAAVIGIFQTLANSVRNQNGKWQCIVLDHARKEIYEGIPEVHEVDEWRDGKKLIPVEWYTLD